MTLLEKLNLSPEERLLLVCARLRLSNDQREELTTLVAGQLDWEQVLHKARWHKLSALLFRHLGDLPYREHVPSEVLNHLKATYLKNVASNLYFWKELRSVLASLEENQIPVILLKGAALAEVVYGDIGLRPMADLDLLVQVEDAIKADSIVRRLGYIPAGTEEVQENLRIGGRQLAALICEGKPVVVEVHSHIVEVDSPLRFDITEFWARAMKVSVDNKPALALGPEDLLIHLSVNFIKDRRFYSYSALGQLCDIAEATRFYKNQINWQIFCKEVGSSNLRGPVFCGLYLANQLLEGDVPDAVLRELEPTAINIKAFEQFARRRVLGDHWVAKELIKPGVPYRWQTVTKEVIKRVVPSRHYLATRYDVPVEAKGIYLLYFRRLGEALSLAAKYAINPRAMKDDFSVDRWLHSMYTSGTNDKATTHK